MVTPPQPKAAFSSMLVLLALISPAAAQGFRTQSVAKESINPVVALQYFLSKCAEIGWDRIFLAWLAMIAVYFFITWGVSRLIAGENGTLKNNVRYFFQSFVAWILTVSAAGALVWFGISSGTIALSIFAVVAAVVVMIMVAFALPMRIFEIGFLKTLLFLIVASIAGGIAQAALSTVFPNPFQELVAKTPEEQQRLIAAWHKQREPEGQTSSSAGGMLLATPENLQRLYTELQQHRAILDPNDTPAVVAFNQKVAQYNIMRAKLDPQFLPKAPAPITPVLPRKRTN